MPRLHLQQTELGPGRYRITVSSDLFTLEHTQDFDFQLAPADQEAIRWYLEDYLDKPFEPNPSIAARTEQRMAEIGRELFEKLFDGRKMIEWWGRAKERLNELRIEVSTSVTAATALPWELLRDPVTETPLALEAAEFVRSHRDADRQPQVPEPAERIRILLVICRPREDRDVPFRSVASQLVRGLNEDARRQVELDVLRPPTFEQLSRRLHEAKNAGQPFHLVHFDGHGLYADPEALKASLSDLDALRFDAGRSGPQGFLLFENPASETNSDFISGSKLGGLLAKAGAPVLVLNACRSAHAEAPDNPEPPAPAAADAEPPAGFAAQAFGGPAEAGTDRAFGSLAQEVMDAGVAGVVAMRYNLWVVTATRFIYELYRNLVRGLSLGAAVSEGRRQLHAEPRRRIAYQEIPLQDWTVPVVFEAAPIRLLPRALETEGWNLTLERGPGAASEEPGALRGALQGLPPPPDIGFIGRDETLLALDRAFDRERVVLLHAYAGSGKTAAAAEFARWYYDTGGLQGGPVLFTGFESYKPLYQVLSDFGEVFGPSLEQQGIVNWGALTAVEERRRWALWTLERVSVLWIWDNLEPVAGFPEGTAPGRAPLARRPAGPGQGAPHAHGRTGRLRRGPGPQAAQAPGPGRLAAPAALYRGQPPDPAGGGAPGPGRGARPTRHHRRGHRRLRRPAAGRRGRLRRRSQRAPRPLPGRLPSVRLRAGLRPRTAAHPGLAGVLPGLRGCPGIADDGAFRGRLVPARAPGLGAGAADRPAGPGRRPRPAGGPGRRLLPHPPGPALVLPPAVRALLSGPGRSSSLRGRGPG